GLAQVKQGVQATRTGLILGTPDFMAPEQASGSSSSVDARSDIYAVGATMFTLLSGESVHPAKSLNEHLFKTAMTPARSLAVVAPFVPKPIVDVIDRALSLNKLDRWGDARQMQEALRAAYASVGRGLSFSSTDSLTDFRPALQ